MEVWEKVVNKIQSIFYWHRKMNFFSILQICNHFVQVHDNKCKIEEWNSTVFYEGVFLHSHSSITNLLSFSLNLIWHINMHTTLLLSVFPFHSFICTPYMLTNYIFHWVWDSNIKSREFVDRKFLTTPHYCFFLQSIATPPTPYPLLHTNSLTHIHTISISTIARIIFYYIWVELHW